MRRCYVHIGAPKTGTTFIQKVLFENRVALESRGMLYPDANLRGFGHHDLAYLLGGGYPDYATPQSRSLDEIADDLKRAVADFGGSLIIDSENFYLCPAPAALADLLERTGCTNDRDVTIIVYVRRQDDAHESWYNQTVKAQGSTHDVAASLEASRELWDYRTQLAAWSQAFGRDAIVVRPYEAQAFTGGSIIEDFFSLIGVSSEGLTVTPERVNSGINRDVLEFQRIVNALPMTIQEKRRFHRSLIELTAKTAGSGLFDERPVLDATARRAIMDAYAESNRAVAQTYLNRDQLFSATSNQDEALSGTPSGLTTEKLALIFGWIMSREG